MRFLILFIAIFSVESHGAIIGTGSASIGVSKLQNESEVGADFSYQLTSDSSYQKTDVSIYTEYTSNSSAIQLSNDHRRLYSTDLTSISVNNKTPILSSTIVWNTDSSFDSKKLTFNADKNEDWYWNTGPKIKKNIRSDLTLEVDSKYGNSEVTNQRSIDTESEIRIVKLLSANKNLRIKYNYLCWDYQEVENINNCNSTYGMALHIRTRSTDANFSIGESVIDKTKSVIYDFKYNYRMSSKNTVNILFSKQFGNLATRMESAVISDLRPSDVSVDNKKIKSVNEFSRSSISLSYEELNYKSEQSSDTNEIIKEFDIRYLLSENLCRSCSLLISNKINTLNKLKWEVYSVGIEYPITRNVLASLAMRHSKDEIFGQYNSLNFQIRYNGIDQHLRAD